MTPDLRESVLRALCEEPRDSINATFARINYTIAEIMRLLEDPAVIAEIRRRQQAARARDGGDDATS